MYSLTVCGLRGRGNESMRDFDTVHKKTISLYTVIYGMVEADAQACCKWRVVNPVSTRVIAIL
jgi:hypothetical protein